MSKVLVVYHSETGNTKKMAEAIAEGASTHVDTVLKSHNDVNNQDFLDADAIIIGSPTYFRQMSSQIKKVIDDSVSIYGRLRGKKGGMFTSSGTMQDAKKALISLFETLDCHGIDVMDDELISIGIPNKEVIAECRKYGEKIALSVK